MASTNDVRNTGESVPIKKNLMSFLTDSRQLQILGMSSKQHGSSSALAWRLTTNSSDREYGADSDSAIVWDLASQRTGTFRPPSWRPEQPCNKSDYLDGENTWRVSKISWREEPYLPRCQAREKILDPPNQFKPPTEYHQVTSPQGAGLP